MAFSVSSAGPQRESTTLSLIHEISSKTSLEAGSIVVENLFDATVKIL
jgi:hypothetical protein